MMKLKSLVSKKKLRNSCNWYRDVPLNFLDEAQAGDNIGVLLRGVQRDRHRAWTGSCKPGTLTCHTKFTAQVYVLTKDEGGRHTPFFNNYRPQFYFRTTDVTGVVQPSRRNRNVHAWR